MNKDIGDSYEKFMRITHENNLLDLEINGVKIWQYSQFEIYNLILSKKKIFDKAHSAVKNKDIVKSLPRVIYNSVFKSALQTKKNTEVLIFNHPRKMIVDNEYVDIYTKYYIEQLSCNYQIIEKPYMNLHYKDIYIENTKYLDDLKLFSKLMTRIKKISFKNADIIKIEAIENDIKNVFGVNINLKLIFSRNIIKFDTNLRYYSKLLKKVKPKVIFLVVSYSYMELIYAAKINKIPTIEIQHGVITKYSIPYNFSEDSEMIEYFPDKLLLFGDFWKKNVNLPLPESSLISAGFPFLEHQVEKYSTVVKNIKQILFISQGTIGAELFKMAMSIANELHDFEIIFKLHPGEYANWKDKYDSEDDRNKSLNFKIIDNNNENIYSLFTKSNIVIGVYSTAIYEALAFKCKCILVDLPGIEYMESLIDESAVLIADDCTDLKNIIKQVYDKDIQVNPNYYFRANSYIEILKNIING